MSVPPSNPQDIQDTIAVLIAVCLSVVYWRIALRLILIIVIALTIYGAVVGIDGVTSLIAQHHR
jgi:hypothetical protein